MNQATPTQELVAKDLHGYEWRFKHIFRGNVSCHFRFAFLICHGLEAVNKPLK